MTDVEKRDEQLQRYRSEHEANNRKVAWAFMWISLAGFAAAVIAEQFTKTAGVAALLFTAGIFWAAVFGALGMAVGL